MAIARDDVVWEGPGAAAYERVWLREREQALENARLAGTPRPPRHEPSFTP